jgi:hypothetical protein
MPARRFPPPWSIEELAMPPVLLAHFVGCSFAISARAYFDIVFSSPTLARNILGSNAAFLLFFTSTIFTYESSQSII